MHYVWDFGILSKYSHLFWLGLAFTLLYTIGTIFLGTLIGLNIPAHVAAVSVLSLYGGAFYAEIVRGSIESVPRGQWDAARALGLGYWRMLRFVIIPQALKPMMAPYVNQSVTQLKNTSLVSVIAVPDLVYNAT